MAKKFSKNCARLCLCGLKFYATICCCYCVQNKETETRLKQETGVDIKELAMIFEKEMQISNNNEEDTKIQDNGNKEDDTPEKCTKFIIQLLEIVQRMKPHSVWYSLCVCCIFDGV